jgi:hypothetical protein
VAPHFPYETRPVRPSGAASHLELLEHPADSQICQRAEQWQRRGASFTH